MGLLMQLLINMSIQYDKLSTGSFVTATSKTVSHTPVNTNYGIVLAFQIGEQNISDVSCTYAGNAMTAIGIGVTTTNAHVYAFYYLNPPAGANNVIASWTTNDAGWIHVVGFTGVDQNTPIGTPVTSSGSSTTPSVTVASAINEIIIDAVVAHAAITANSQGVGQAQIINQTTVVNASQSIHNGLSSVVMSWVMANSNWATLGVSIKPFKTQNKSYRGRKRTPGAVSI
jgi:hypothetical protein